MGVREKKKLSKITRGNRSVGAVCHVLFQIEWKQLSQLSSVPPSRLISRNDDHGTFDFLLVVFSREDSLLTDCLRRAIVSLPISSDSLPGKFT